MIYQQPDCNLPSYTCPHCGTLAQQHHKFDAGNLDGYMYSDPV